MAYAAGFSLSGPPRRPPLTSDVASDALRSHPIQVAADLSHINTPAKVAGFLPADNGAEKALAGADIVVIPAGVPRKPGMT
jgi:malate dehydrogenase